MAKNICKFLNSGFPDTLTVSCFVLETNPETMILPQKLANNRMVLAVDGEGILKTDENALRFSMGKLFFGFEGEIFCVNEIKNISYMYIDFRGTRAQELLHRFNINKENRSFDNFDGLIPMWSESLLRASEQTIDLVAESILLYTFSHLDVVLGKHSSLISKIIDLTEDHFTEQTFSLSELSNNLSYNSKYLSHLFRKNMNLSYSEYLCTLRIKYAVSLFDYGIDSVKNVALLSGFADPLYFSKVFKKKIGVSPKEYINQKARAFCDTEL